MQGALVDFAINSNEQRNYIGMHEFRTETLSTLASLFRMLPGAHSAQPRTTVRGIKSRGA